MERRLFLFLASFLFTHCGTPQTNESIFEKGVAVGVNKNKRLEEASGLAASSRNPGHFWSHNDGGHPAEIFLMDERAVTRRVFTLSTIVNRDWEDIARGPGPEENTSYLYVGDIGDNLSRYPLKYIYRLKEPSLEQPEEITEVDTLVIKLEVGALDTEALLCDPISKNLYLISKREKSVRVFEIAYPLTDDTLVAKNVCTIPVKNITGGDVSPDGNEVLLKNYEKIYYWRKIGNETLVDLLKTPPTELPYDREQQGEGISWAYDGSGFYTLGENAKGERAKLLFYKRKQQKTNP